MNGFNKFLVSAFMSPAMLLPSIVQAMEIRQFDKMADQDQGEYVGLLVEGAVRVLNDEGRTDLAAQVTHLFTTKDPGDTDPIGMVEFESNLARARDADANRVLKNPNARRLEVEDAVIVTLRKNGIELPPSFLTVNCNFHPKFPPKDAKKKDDTKKN